MMFRTERRSSPPRSIQDTTIFAARCGIMAQTTFGNYPKSFDNIKFRASAGVVEDVPLALIEYLPDEEMNRCRCAPISIIIKKKEI